MPNATAPDLALVRSQLEEILSDPAQRTALLGGTRFTPELRRQLEDVSAQVGSMLQDESLGRVMGGPLWLSGASVVNGTITAGKISVNSIEAITTNTGALNVTGSFIAAASYPAVGARVEINATGLYGYNATPAQTFKLGVDGSGFIGIGGSQMAWDNAGVLTIPAAAIGSLTIANVGGGTLGGTYQTGAGTTRIDLSTAGITAYATGTPTFSLNATTGAMTATGSFTIQSASSGTRVVLSSAGGIEGYNGTTQTFLLNAATGAGQLGPTAGGNYISWSSTGVTIGGVAMSGGKIVASALSVTSLSALSADLGTITAGTITGGTITAGAITTGTLSAARISGGTLGGGFALGANSITIPAGGSISNADGDTWDSTGITLVSTGAFGDALKWKVGGVTYGSIYATAGTLEGHYASGSGGFWILTSAVAQLGMASNLQLVVSGTTNKIFAELNDTLGVSSFVVVDSNLAQAAALSSNGRLFLGNQSTGYINWDGTNVQVAGADLYIPNYLKLGAYGTAASGALPNPTKWFALKAEASTWYVPAWSANGPWAA